jgi:DNA repair ATPase RecN
MMEKEGWLPPNGTINMATLAAALMRITNNVACIPKQALNRINATAILLGMIENHQKHRSLAEMVNDMITPTIDRLGGAADKTRQDIAQLLSRTQANTKALEELRGETHALKNLHDQLNSAVNKLTQQAEKVETATHNATQERDMNCSPATRHNKPPIDSQYVSTPSPQSYTTAV